MIQTFIIPYFYRILWASKILEDSKTVDYVNSKYSIVVSNKKNTKALLRVFENQTDILWASKMLEDSKTVDCFNSKYSCKCVIKKHEGPSMWESKCQMSMWNNAREQWKRQAQWNLYRQFHNMVLPQEGECRYSWESEPNYCDRLGISKLYIHETCSNRLPFLLEVRLKRNG